LASSESEKFWKEVTAAESKYYCGICTERLRKTIKDLIKTGGVAGEIVAKQLSNRSLNTMCKDDYDSNKIINLLEENSWLLITKTDSRLIKVY
jgi:hypothetical protein